MLTCRKILVVDWQLGLFDGCIDGLQFARLFHFLVCDNDVSILDVLEPVYREPTLAALSCLGNVLFDVFERVESACTESAYVHAPSDGPTFKDHFSLVSS